MRLGIHYRTAVAFGAVVAVILCVFYAYLSSTLEKHAFQRTEADLHKEAFVARTMLEKEVLAPSEGGGPDSLANEIGRLLHSRVTVIDLEGNVLGDSELDGERLLQVENHLYRPEVQEALRRDTGESERFSTTLRKHMLYVAARFHNPGMEGVVRLAMPLSDVALVSQRLRQVLAGALALVFLATIAMSFVVSAFVSRPLKEMSSVARSIATGDFSRYPSVTSRDEVGDLSNALRHMSDQVRLRLQEVVSSRSRLEAVLLSMFDGVMVVDASGTILLMNETLRSLLGVVGDPAGRKPLEVVRNADIQEVVDTTLRHAGGVEARELTLVVPVERTLLVHATPVVQEGKSEGAVLVFHDISELRRLEKVRQDFVANISHELRTPVCSIKGYAETLLDGALDDREHARDFLNIIHSDSERLARLIDDILDISRIESGGLRMEPKPCSLGEILRRAVSALEKPAGEKRIRLTVDVPANLPAVIADQNRIDQVLSNLLDNALKYTESGGTVTVTARQHDGHVRVDVTDTGVGILEKDLTRVFERFYRVAGQQSSERAGTGLGLSIVKHIVQAHGGQVSAQSVYGRGSTFSFTLPTAGR
ncbi:MAG: HAMP domain-containing protein [Candidatus Eisenbacteria bacterium]|nr:HAMP domain-containing protein [Candidatus Eisenbacteria bacterium]